MFNSSGRPETCFNVNLMLTLCKINVNMAHVLKTRQNFHDFYSIGFLGLLFILSIVKGFFIISLGNAFSWEMIALISLVAFLGGSIYFLAISRLKLKIGKTNILIAIEPIGWTKMKFGKEEVENYEFFAAHPLTISSGLFVHFGNRQRVYNFGDSNGVKLSLKNGKDVVIFSNEVFERRGEIEKMLA